MNRSHSQRSAPGFIEGVGIALVASVVVSIVVASFGWVMPYQFLGYLLAVAVGLAYLLYLLSRSRHRTGRITVVALYIVTTAGMVLSGLPPASWTSSASSLHPGTVPLAPEMTPSASSTHFLAASTDSWGRSSNLRFARLLAIIKAASCFSAIVSGVIVHSFRTHLLTEP